MISEEKSILLLLWYSKCGTCRKAKAWLDAKELDCALRDIVQDPPTVLELREWRKWSGVPLKRFFNTSGMAYRALGLKDRLPEMGEEKALELLASDGMLVKRPLLVMDGAVLIGFREETWADKLE